MASGRKNRGSRHRSHRHRQQRGDESGDSDAEQNLLRHGPNPNPNPNSSSPPWAMEPLPPNVEGPSVLKLPGMENADRDSHHDEQRRSQVSATTKRRKGNLGGDSTSVIDRWDGGGGADENTSGAFLGQGEGNFATSGDVLDSKGQGDGRNNKGKGRATNMKGMENPDPLHNIAQTSSKVESHREYGRGGSNDGSLVQFGKSQSPPDTSKVGGSRNSTKDRELEDPPSHSLNSSVESEWKRAKRSDSSQKSWRPEVLASSSLVEPREEDGSVALGKGDAGAVQDVMRNIELEKELESRIRRRREESGDRERWREGVKGESKGSRNQNEEHPQVRHKDEKGKPEKLKDDGDIRSGKELGSRRPDERWKSIRHLDDRHSKDESFNKAGDNREGWGKHDKDYEQRKKADRSRGDRSLEKTAKDDRQEEVMGSKDDSKSGRSKDVLKDAEEKDERDPDVRHKESRSKESRLRDEKARDIRLKTERNIVEDRLLSSETPKKESFNREETFTGDSHPDEPKRAGDKAKEEKPKPKDRGGKSEQLLRDEREKIDKYRVEDLRHPKTKHDKKRGEAEQLEIPKHKEDVGLDGAADLKGRKKSAREQDYDLKYSKRKTEEGGIEKQQDGKDVGDRQKHEHYKENHQDSAKQIDGAMRHGRFLEGNDRERDSWASGERAGRERTRDDANRHSQRRDSKERRWGGGVQDERGKNSKEVYDRQKHGRDADERARYGGYSAGKQRGDRGKDDRKPYEYDKPKDDSHQDLPGPVFERLGGSKESSRKADMGEKESRYIDLDKVHHDDQVIKASKERDGQSKLRGTREPLDVREIKGLATSKADRMGSKASKSTSQDQERVLSGPGAKEGSTPEKFTKKPYDSDVYNLGSKDFSRPRGRAVDESGGHEDKPFHEKPGRKKKYEPSVSLSSSGGPRWPRDQNWPLADQGKHYYHGHEEEVRSWEPRVPNQESDDERRWPFTQERTRDSLSPRGPRGGYEDVGRSADPVPSRDASVSKRKYDNFSQGAGPTKHRRGDDTTSVERSDWGNWPSVDGPMGSRPMPPNRHLGPSGLLPPPPPYRPGVDNLTVMGAHADVVEGANSREPRRFDRKGGGGYSRRSEMVGPGDTWAGFGMGHWNAHNQGPVPNPGNMFPSFPQIGAGFLGVGQQFHVPQVFGPNSSRSSVNMGYGGRFRMGDGGAAGYVGHPSDHGPGMGWHRFSDGNEGQRFMHAWEGPGRYADERQRFGHPEWDQFSQGFAGRSWDGGPVDPWQGQSGDTNFNKMPHSHREAPKFGGGMWPDLEVDNTQAVEDKVVETREDSPVPTEDKAEGQTLKDVWQAAKERKQRLLVHANVRANLVDPELYKEYLSLLPPSEVLKKKAESNYESGVDVLPPYVDEDLEFEVNTKAQDLLKSFAPSESVLPLQPENAYQDALKLFRRSLQHNHGSFLLPVSIVSWPGAHGGFSLEEANVKGSFGGQAGKMLAGPASGAQVSQMQVDSSDRALTQDTASASREELVDDTNHGTAYVSASMEVDPSGGHNGSVDEIGRKSTNLPEDFSSMDDDEMPLSTNLEAPQGIQEEDSFGLQGVKGTSETVAFPIEVEEESRSIERAKSTNISDPEGSALKAWIIYATPGTVQVNPSPPTPAPRCGETAAGPKGSFAVEE